MSPSRPALRSAALGIALAVGAVAFVTVIKAGLIDLVVDDTKDPFALYIGAVAVAAWRGWSWGLIAIVLSTVAADYFFLRPVHSLHLHDPGTLWLMLLHVAESSLIVWLIARLTAARHTAESAVTMRDRIVATVSHDLRGPLQTILAWTHGLLGDRPLDPTRGREALEAIRRSGLQQKRLIEDLLDLSVATQGRLQLRARRMELGSLVRALVETWRPQCEQHGLILESDAVREPVLVDGDADRLRQVLDNLVSNSMKFTRAGGFIRVDLDALRDWAVIRVVDSGDGIDPAMLERIFDPWTQEGQRRAQGVGLGLAITRQLVELHRGRIHALSAGKNRGTTFEIRLPRAA